MGQQMKYLSQAVAAEKAVKAEASSVIGQLYAAFKEPSLFNGEVRKYRPLAEDGEKFPDEATRVQMRVEEAVQVVFGKLADLFDITLIKDLANGGAKADVMVDDTVLLKEVPAVYLLFLEKQLGELAEGISKAPVLSASEDWEWDANAKLHRTQPVDAARSKKVQRALTLYPATDKHPAQCQLVTEDVTIGYWAKTKLSGALPLPKKEALLARIQKLVRAVKLAREEANTAPIRPVDTSALFAYLTGK